MLKNQQNSGNCNFSIRIFSRSRWFDRGRFFFIKQEILLALLKLVTEDKFAYNPRTMPCLIKKNLPLIQMLMRERLRKPLFFDHF